MKIQQWWILMPIVLVELYYWLWWLPRNWRKNREARQLFGGMKKL